MKYINLSLVSMIVTAFILKVKELICRNTNTKVELFGITDKDWDEAIRSVHIVRSMEIVIQFAKPTDSTNQTEIYNWILGPSLGTKADQVVMRWCILNLVPENGYRVNKVFNRMATECKILQWPMSSTKQIELLNIYNRLMYASMDKEGHKT